MNIGPDGTLARITSTVKENNIIILKVPDTDKKKPVGPPYTLLAIGAEKINHDATSETSDDETEDLELNNVRLNIMNIKLANELQAEKEHHDKKDIETGKSQKHESNKKDNNLQFKGFQPARRFSRSKKHKSNISNTLSINRNYNVSNNNDNYFKTYTDSGYIEPWLRPEMVNNLHNVQMPIVQQYFPEVMQYRTNIPLEPTVISTTPDSFARSNPTSSVGLLGHSPYSPIPAQYLYNKQEHNLDHMWHDQSAGNNCNYWNDNYSNNFHMPIESIPVEQNQINNYQNNIPYGTWRGNRRKNTSRWIRNSPKNQKKWRRSKNRYQSTPRKSGYRPWHTKHKASGIK